MKKFYLFLIVSFCSSIAFSQTLFTYGRHAVSKQEFLKAYNKNKAAVTDKKTALKEYLELYIKFKLKVRAALDMRLDTLANINTDLQSFRNQVEQNYLNDESEVNALVREAFTRSLKDIRVSHLFVPFGNASVTVDTLKAYKAAQEAYNALTGNRAFADVAAEINKNLVEATTADIGFITVFSLPYEFESIIYNLKPGQVSTIYRGRNGYHLFKNTEERPAVGKMKAAQILISIPPASGDAEKKRAARVADSAYKALAAGADFTELAKAISDDKMTFANGGLMPEFGAGKYEPAFESKAFSLQKDGEITAPFITSFGYHIVKRLRRTPVITDQNDAENSSSLKQQVLQDPRISIAKEKLLKGVLQKLGFKKIPVNETELWRITDSFLVNEKNPQVEKYKKTPLYSFNANKVYAEDWLSFARDFKANAAYKGERYPEIMKNFISAAALEKYRQKLEDYNEDFKYQIQEFKDGNILFEIMEKNVWSKASNDSAGLANYYEQHKNEYLWKESADAILVSCSNVDVAKAAVAEIKNGKGWKQVAEENPGKIQTDSGRYELTQIPVNDKTNLSEGMVTEPVRNESDTTASFVKIIHLYPANEPRNFEESRGLVINDYQDFIEDKWIVQLKKKYPVSVNQKVFQTLVN